MSRPLAAPTPPKPIATPTTWCRSSRGSTRTALCRPAIPVSSIESLTIRPRRSKCDPHRGTRRYVSDRPRRFAPSILDIVTVQSATLWPVNFPLRRSIVSRRIAMRLTQTRRGPICLYQVLDRNRQRPSARAKFAEQIAVQIVYLRANENSDPNPIAPDPAVSHDGYDLRRVGIKNDVLGKDEILSHGFASKTTGWRQSLWLRDDRAATLKTRS
jgi:hypothetical protein